MKINLMKHLRLSLAVWALGGSAGIAYAASDLLWTFDNSNAVYHLPEVYVTNSDSTITTNLTPTWTFWYNNQPVWTWSSNDASNNPNSGSLEWQLPDNGYQSISYCGFDPDLSGNLQSTDMGGYQQIEFDVMVDPSSTTNADGNFGWIQPGLYKAANGGGHQDFGPIAIPYSASGNWVHIIVPLPAAAGVWDGISFLWQSWYPWPNGYPNAGTIYYFDNIKVKAYPPSPKVVQQPRSTQLYSGKNATFSVVASGAAPFTYMWYKGTSQLSDGGNVSGSATNVLNITGVSAGDVANYTVVITNIYGAITSSVASLSIIAPEDAESAATAALNPFAFYPLSETTDPATGNALAFDPVGSYVGSYDTLIQNGANGIAGPSGPGFAHGKTAALLSNANNANGWIVLPPFNLNTNTVSFTAWINPNIIADGITVIGNRVGSTCVAMTWAGGGGNFGCNWNNDSASWSWRPNVFPPLNQWSFVAMVADPINGYITMYCFTSTQLAQTDSGGVNPVNQAFDGTSFIGSDGGFSGRTWGGALADIGVFNKTLTADQVQHLYFVGAGGPALFFDGQNLNWNLLGNATATIQQASSLNGPWTTLQANANPPYSITPSATGAKFYRLQVTESLP
jgi:hypothetical protein